MDRRLQQPVQCSKVVRGARSGHEEAPPGTCPRGIVTEAAKLRRPAWRSGTPS
ncbi:hypothetical protein APY03_1422 [Variovorax sp. WDL1]|nr:hypothetical protein APY03_1422 [Variovorax sp. WDL1]